MSLMQDATGRLIRLLGAEAIAYQDAGQPWTCRDIRPDSVAAHLRDFHGLDLADQSPDWPALRARHILQHLRPADLAVPHTHKAGT